MRCLGKPFYTVSMCSLCCTTSYHFPSGSTNGEKEGMNRERVLRDPDRFKSESGLCIEIDQQALSSRAIGLSKGNNGRHTM